MKRVETIVICVDEEWKLVEREFTGLHTLIYNKLLNCQNHTVMHWHAECTLAHTNDLIE